MTDMRNATSTETGQVLEERLADLTAAVNARSDIELILTLIEGVTAQAQHLAHQNTHLETALDSNRRVGTAMGILMIQHRVTEQAAFAALRHVSQNTHRKLRDVADDVILTGQLPTT